MSKLRQQPRSFPDDLTTPAEGDLTAYSVFTQLKPGAKHICAGWLDAADDHMAVQFACEHYGQDQQCVNIWVVRREDITGTEPDFAPRDEPSKPRTYRVFTRAVAGDPAISAGTVEADCGAAALDAALATAPDADAVFVAPAESVVGTEEGELIWRHTDQSYRLARGYSKDVREKWEKVRAERDIEEYEKEDLKESF